MNTGDFPIAAPARHASKSAQTAEPAYDVEDHASLLSAIIDTTPECIKIVARDGRLLQMNAAGLAMIGADAFAHVENACTYDLIAPEHRATWRANHERVCNGERMNWEFDIVGLDGRRRHMESHSAPIVVAEGVAQLAITRDVSLRRETEDELLQLNLSLQAKISERTRELERALAQLGETERSFERLVD